MADSLSFIMYKYVCVCVCTIRKNMFGIAVSYNSYKCITWQELLKLATVLQLAMAMQNDADREAEHDEV